MQGLTNVGAIRELLGRHGFTFSKALGQNFIVNPSVCPRIAEASGACEASGTIEIGPGIGVLTRELAARAGKVVCIELDRRLLPILDETLSDFHNIKVINDDVLKVDLAALIAEEFPGMPVDVCANLPYYITSPILMGLLEARLPIRTITVMVQREAADRLCALPGTRAVGAVSIAVRYYSEPEFLFPVSRGSFLPAPNVDSAVIRLRLRRTPLFQLEDEHAFFRVVRGAFSQRRKTAVNALAGALGLPKAQVAAAAEHSGIPPTARPEQLTMEQFRDFTLALGPLPHA